MPPLLRYNFPTSITIGPGARRQVAPLLAQRGVRRPLIVTDRGLAALPLFDAFAALLRDAGFDVEVFSEIAGNPTKSQADDGASAYKQRRCDGVVAIGGGAAIDIAKCIALMATQAGDLLDYEDDKPNGRTVQGEVALLVALPTTAGTGSEVGRSAVVSDDRTHVKKIIFDPKLLPKAVFADPELTLALPAAITASTGMDALAHLVEAYLAKGTHPMCDGIALEGLRLVQRSLEQAVRFAADKAGATEAHLSARQDMLDAAMMGAVAFQKGLGVTHSCAHALSAVCDMHHGLANAVMLPYAMAFNARAAAQRFATMASVLGLQPRAEALLAWLRDLKARIGMPATLRDAGVARSELGRLVDAALADSCHLSNPCPVAAADFRAIFEAAFA